MFSRLNKNGLSSFLNLRAKLVFIYVSIFGLFLVTYCLILYNVFSASHEADFDNALRNYAVDVSNTSGETLFGDIALDPDILSETEKKLPFELGETLLQIRTNNGFPVIKSRSIGRTELPISPEDLESIPIDQVQFKTIKTNDFAMGLKNKKNYRLINYFIARPGGNNFILQIAVPLSRLEKELERLSSFFIFSIPVFLFIASMGGLYLSRKALAPFNAIIDKTKTISVSELSRRVPVPDSHDEIRELALTQNELLDRIEKAFRVQESFIADASHQLKTPLAILRGEIDLMMSKERSKEETQEFLASASQEVGSLSEMVEDLLILARADSTSRDRLTSETVRVDEVLMELVARLQKTALKKNARIVIQIDDQPEDSQYSKFEIQADLPLIRSLYENILENSIKYSECDKPIQVNLRENKSQIVVSFINCGPTIPTDMLTKIFDRFVRAESTRDRIPGSGLGLAIARKIALLYQGEVTARNVSLNSVEFQVCLPKS